MNDTDLQLLTRYTSECAEDAFAELVRRHVDLVYSASLRQVRSPQLAEEVAQSVFADLARNAHRLCSNTVLTAWLYQVARRTAVDVVRREVRRQLREQTAAEMNALNTAAPDWATIEPLLDQAMEALDETDRVAVLLRYFENKTLREIGQSLGTTEDAAQKRVSRAVERLREYFGKSGVTVGANGLGIALSTNAVKAAPLGLANTISSAVASAGSAASAFPVTKSIAMTILQKAIITTSVAVALCTGIYAVRHSSSMRIQTDSLLQQQVVSAELIRHLQKERDEATNQLAAWQDKDRQSNQNNTELLKLRGMVTLLRNQLAASTNILPPATAEAHSEPIRPVWKLKEPRRFEELQNVGNDTPEAAAETVLWAAHNRSTNVLDMIHLPPDVLSKAQEEGVLDILPRALGVRILAMANSVSGESKQVWLDGGQETVFTATDTTGTNTYAGVLDFHLSGRDISEDPTTERHTDMLFTKIDGVWKLVLPGLSPPIAEQ